MSRRFLFATIPVTGHVNPGLPIARELVARGHDVRWYATARFKKAIEAVGARWVPYRHAMPIDEANLGATFTDRPAAGLAQLRYDIRHLFIDIIPGQLRDLREELDREPADVIVGDNASAVCQAIQELRGIPWAVYGISVLALPSRDTAPFGLALPPSATPLGRLRNRALYWLTDNVIFREATKHNAAMRRRLGLSQLDGSIFGVAGQADLYLQSSVPSFEYPRTDLPEHFHYIGASIPQASADWNPPAWWGELDRRRVVLVTQGTINNDYDQLVRPAIRALGSEDVLVVVTTGSRPAADVGLDPLPWNVRVEKFIPYAHLMPKVDLLLTNGGYGSIQIALAHGVPVVAIGKTEEKPEIAARVEWAGVGVGLNVKTPKESQIREAVLRVLQSPAYAARAEAVRYEMARSGGAARGADLLEQLAGARSLARSA